jgi:hypothetical protein
VRAEATPARPPAASARAPAGGFDEALRRALAREARERKAREGEARPGTVSTPGSLAPGSAAAPGPPGEPVRSGKELGSPTSETPAIASSAIASAARAGEVAALIRAGGRAQLEIAAGEDLRYRLCTANGGVEIRALAGPGLERVARADLHAVADALRRRGVRLHRAEVHPEPGRGGGARGAGRR